MKKKYRRVVCFSINSMMILPMFPFWLIAIAGIVSERVLDFFMDLAETMKYKFRIYDDDPD